MSEQRSIWLVTVGEPLPINDNRDRLWRTGLLAGQLASRGHRVLWWTSTVDHFRKQLFVAGEPRVASRIDVPIQFLAGDLYRRNLSLKRLRNHEQIARRFAALAPREPRPDLLLCSFPTIELCREAVRYARANDVPVILDVRDLWPDIFLDVVPPAMKPLARLALRGLFEDARNALAECDAVLGVSSAYLEWGLRKSERSPSNLDAVFPLAYQPSPWSAEDAAAVERRLAESQSPAGLPLVTVAGTFGRTYDLATVIAAERILADELGTRVHFVLCGTGERAPEWQALAAGRNVTFTGWLAGGELAYLLSRSVVGLAAYSPSAPQGIPNKVIEYLSAALPVACCLPGECRELLEHTGCGFYYEAGNAASLAAVLSDALANEQRLKTMGATARQLFDERFAAATVYAAMADHLERIAASGRSGRRQRDVASSCS